jgi:excinuclease ABC subunit B
MERALAEMSRRREIQRAYNLEHNITPMGIVKSLDEVRLSTHVADQRNERTDRADTRAARKGAPVEPLDLHDPAQRAVAIAALEQQMRQAAANLEFELAAMLRDQLNDLRAADAPNVRRGGARGGRR